MLALFAAVTFLIATPQMPKLPAITREPQVTYVDAAGAVIGVRGGQFAPMVDVAKLPAHVPGAFVAIEDRRFYSHNGVDPIGVARAAVNIVKDQRLSEGGSTITQQLARNLFLTQDKTLERKAIEAAYAVQLEQKYSKRQILGLYLSRVNFGKGAYGLEAAARRYFNKPAARLTIKEAAILAGIMKSPTHYNPVDNPNDSATRALLVLNAMAETGVITPAQQTKAAAEKPKVWSRAPNASAQYFVDWVDTQRRQLVGAPKQDIIVETTLDNVMQAAADEAARSTVARYGKQRAEQAAVVAVDGTGRVRTLLGGVDHAKAPFNRAVSARRQAGSAWKPFVYLAALEAGRRPDMAVVDEPVTIGGWSPRNYDDGFLGPMTLEMALAKSVNTVAARLADEVGRDNVAAAARRLGFVSPINTDPAMALGSAGVTPLEMAQAYAAFANGGDRVNAYGVERIRAAGGAILYQRPAPVLEPAIQNPALSDLNRMMRLVMTVGTGGRAATPGYDLAGKTGTTSDYKDAWFCGHTGGLAVAVWMGRDDATPMSGITGGGAPAELWRSFMGAALKRAPPSPIPYGRPAAEPAEPAAPADPIGELIPLASAA